MKRMIASRGTGKSTEILRMALEDKDAAIVVPTNASVECYCAIAYDVLGVPLKSINKQGNIAKIKDVIVAPISAFCWREGRGPFCERNMYIDEIEMCVQKMMAVFGNLAGYTLSIK